MIFLSTLSLRRATDELLVMDQPDIFLSTLSLRRATWSDRPCAFSHVHFYPRSPCGERPIFRAFVPVIRNFYPRSPCGERLLTQWCIERRKIISIHALLAESDLTPIIAPAKRENFYPRSPCGERQLTSIFATEKRHFYPRSPCGERLTMWTAAI